MGNPVNISAEARICLANGNPDSSSNQTLITGLGVVEKIALAGSIVGGFSSAARLTEVALEKACTPTRESLGRAIDGIQRKNLAQLGFWLFVRVKYEEYVRGLFYQGMEEKFTKWEQYTKGGIGGAPGIQGLAGTYESPQEASEDVQKAMKWTLKKFIEGHR